MHLANLDLLISVSLQKLENLSVIWASNDLERKRIMHKTLFPEGIFYDAEKHECLTTQTNGFIALTNCLAEEYKQNKNRNHQFLLEDSGLVETANKLSNCIKTFFRRIYPLKPLTEKYILKTGDRQAAVISQIDHELKGLTGHI